MNNKSENIFDVQGNVVILTGGSGKLGSVYTNYLVDNGAIICNFDINKPSDELLNLSDENYSFFKTDLTKKEDISKSLNQVINQFGIPDALINNAALDSPPGSEENQNGAFEEYPELSWDKVMEVNLKSVFLCCQIIGAEMAKNGAGSIINISSHYGVISPDQRIYEYRKKVFNKPISYSASKSGILNITRYLSTYWGERNVRVNTLTLGGVLDNQDKEFIENYSSKVPLKRMANESEYNGAIQFLISSASSYVTGSNMIIDGGWTAW